MFKSVLGRVTPSLHERNKEQNVLRKNLYNVVKTRKQKNFEQLFLPM